MRSKASQNGQGVRYDILGRLCAEKRVRDGLSLRDVAAETDISASTLSRLENGRMVDTKQVATLAKWLGVSVERFMPSPRTENLPRAVKAMLLADPKLSRDEADALGGTFSALYRQMARS